MAITERKPSEQSIQEMRKEIIGTFTVSVLSLIIAGEIDELKKLNKKPTEIQRSNFPQSMNIAGALGISHSDKKTRGELIKKVLIVGFEENLYQLWDKDPATITDPKDREINIRCRELEQRGYDVLRIITDVNQRFSTLNLNKPALNAA